MGWLWNKAKNESTARFYGRWDNEFPFAVAKTSHLPLLLWWDGVLYLRARTKGKWDASYVAAMALEEIRLTQAVNDGVVQEKNTAEKLGRFYRSHDDDWAESEVEMGRQPLLIWRGGVLYARHGTSNFNVCDYRPVEDFEAVRSPAPRPPAYSRGSPDNPSS